MQRQVSGVAEATRSGHSSGGFDLRGDGSGSVRAYWYDTFEVRSNSLAAGTPVNLALGVNLNIADMYAPADLGACSVGGTGGCASALASIHFAGPDCCTLASKEVRTPLLGEPTGGFITNGTGSGTYATAVGATFTLVGVLRLNAFVNVNYDDAYAAKVAASAVFNIDPTTPDAFLVSGSGVNYGALAPVPEPHAWAMLLAGLAGISLFARRRRVA